MALTLRLITKPDDAILLNEEKRFAEEGGSVGRADHCELILPDDSKHISKIHALIHFRDEQYFITDVSANGVFVNSETVPIGKGNTKQLLENDKLRIGAYVLQASLSDAVEPSVQITSTPINPAHITSLDDDLESLLADSGNLDDLLTAEPVMQSAAGVADEQSIDDLLEGLSDDPSVLDIDNLQSSDMEIADLLSKNPQNHSAIDVMAVLNPVLNTDALLEKVLAACSMEAYLSFCMENNIELSDDDAVYNKATLDKFFASLQARKVELKKSLEEGI